MNKADGLSQQLASPFATEEVGRIVATILMSILEPDLNVIQVPSRNGFAFMA